MKRKEEGGASASCGTIPTGIQRLVLWAARGRLFRHVQTFSLFPVPPRSDSLSVTNLSLLIVALAVPSEGSLQASKDAKIRFAAGLFPGCCWYFVGGSSLGSSICPC